MKQFWNLVFALFFAALVLAGIYWLMAQDLVFYDVPPLDLLLMALAVFRLVRLFTYDLITQFIRDWFVGAKEGSLSFTLGQLLGCPWCTGLWFSFFVVFLYFATSWAWPLILVLAIAGVGSFIQLLANLIGWTAEERKRIAQSLGSK